MEFFIQKNIFCCNNRMLLMILVADRLNQHITIISSKEAFALILRLANYKEVIARPFLFFIQILQGLGRLYD